MFNELQKKYIEEDVRKNKGSNTVATKDTLIEYAIGKIDFKKNSSKDKLVDLLLEYDREEFFSYFAKYVSVSKYYIAMTYNISYKKLVDLEELGIIKLSGFTDNKGYSYYDLDILKFETDELNTIWNKKYKDGFNRVRIEFKKRQELEDMLDTLEKNFEIRKRDSIPTYENREGEGSFAYLSMRIK